MTKQDEEQMGREQLAAVHNKFCFSFWALVAVGVWAAIECIESLFEGRVFWALVDAAFSVWCASYAVKTAREWRPIREASFGADIGKSGITEKRD